MEVAAVISEFLYRLPATLELLLASLAIAAIAGLGLNALSNRLPPAVSRWTIGAAALALRCIPFFWLAIALEFLAIIHKIDIDGPRLHFLGAAATLALFPLPIFVEHGHWRPLLRELARHLPDILAAALITEAVYAWPGVNRLVWSAIQLGDGMGLVVVVILSTVFVLVMKAIVSLSIRFFASEGTANDA